MSQEKKRKNDKKGNCSGKRTKEGKEGQREGSGRQREGSGGL